MVRILLSILLIQFVSSRYFVTTLKFNLFGINKGWVYIDKMTFAPGTATVELKTYTTGAPYGRDSELFLQAISEDKWQNQSVQRCNNSVRMPLAVHSLKLNGQETSSWFSFRVQDYTTYYFVMKDCQSRFLSEYNNNNLLMMVKLHLMNNDREVGEEEDHWYIVPFIILAGMALLHYYLRQFKMAGPRDPDWSKMLLFIGTVSQISSLFWKSIGFVIYSFTGSDFFFFHLIYLILHSTSEAAMVGLVILIGFGWTLTFSYGKHFEVFLPLVGCLAFINIIITIITKLDHDHDRHHLFDSVGGGILICFRVVLTLVFLGGSIYTYRKVRITLKKFMLKFMILGFIYVSSMPIIVLVANWNVAARNRHQFVFICVQVIKFCANLVLGYEMNVEESEYSRVNYKNASFLPEDEKGF